MKLAKLAVVLFCLPSFAFASAPAEYKMVQLPLPSGVLYWTLQIIMPTKASAKEITFKERMEDWIDKKAAQYGANAEDMKKTIGGSPNCKWGESNFTHYGADGKVIRGKAGEYGICQYMMDTWLWWEKEFNRPDLSLYDPYDQIEMMAIAFAHGKQSHWTCAQKL